MYTRTVYLVKQVLYTAKSLAFVLPRTQWNSLYDSWFRIKAQRTSLSSALSGGWHGRSRKFFSVGTCDNFSINILKLSFYSVYGWAEQLSPWLLKISVTHTDGEICSTLLRKLLIVYHNLECCRRMQGQSWYPQHQNFLIWMCDNVTAHSDRGWPPPGLRIVVDSRNLIMPLGHICFFA